MGDLVSQGALVLLVQFRELLEARRVLRNESALLEKRQNALGQALFLLKCPYAREQLVLGDAHERVLDFALCILGERSELLGCFRFRWSSLAAARKYVS